MGKLKILNYTLLQRFEDTDGGKKYKVVTNSTGEEIGIELRGRLTTFDVENENGQTFKAKSYDNFVNDYFVNNSINVPVCLLHNDTDMTHLCGIVSKMTATSDGVDIVVFVPKSAYFYNLTKNYIDCGILQGFSNYGWATDYTFENDTFNVKDFQLLHVAIVSTPSDVGGTLSRMAAKNTLFSGFGNDTPENVKTTTTTNQVSAFDISPLL